MPRPRDLAAGLVLAAALVTAARGAEPARDAGRGSGVFDLGDLRNRKDPITITSDTLEYDYKANVIVYRGDVAAVQGPVKLRSETLTVTLEGNGDAAAARSAPAVGAGEGGNRLHEIVAVGGVRIDSGSRWATGGRAVFDQTKRTVVLTEDPDLHDGANEVAGDRVVVYLDEDRSVVEGGRKRVKAVLFPDKDHGLTPPPKAGAAAPAPVPPEAAAP